MCILQKLILTAKMIVQRRCPRQQAVPDYSAQDLEKQKAYFQDIDAFELPVEEVSLADLD